MIRHRLRDYDEKCISVLFEWDSASTPSALLFAESFFAYPFSIPDALSNPVPRIHKALVS